MKQWLQDKEFYQQLKELMIPIALQNFLLAAVSAGDSAMLGFVSENAMAAVSLAANIEFIENLFLSAVVCGATILCSQYWGKGDKKTVETVFHLILRYAIVISVLFTITALCIPELLMSAFTNESELITIGADYIRFAAGSYLLTGITQCYLCIMKTTGQTKQSVFISSFALGLDTILNFLFIFGFHMEAKGAALTTSISRTIELILVLSYASRMNVRLVPGTPVSKELHMDFLRCSIPNLINCLVWGLGTTMYSVILGHLGTAITAANSVAAIVRKLSIAVCRGLGQGGEILLAGVLGSGNLEKGVLYGRRLSRLSILCGVLCACLVLLFGPVLSHFMTLSEAARYDLQIMIYISAFYMLAQCINVVVINGIFSAGGDTAFDAYSVAVTMWLIIIPLALAAAFIWKLPALTVYLILSMDEAIKIPWVYIHYKKYKWKKNITRETTI